MNEPIPRRSLLAGLSTLAAAVPLLGGAREARASGSFTLAPSYRAGWRVHKTFAGSSIAQIPGGIRVVTPRRANQADIGQIALWSVGTVQGDFEFAFTYKVLSRVSVSGGSFGAFYFDTIGEGSARYPLAVPSWVAITPSDPVYADHARGLRFSFATFNPGAPDVHQRLRLRSFEFTPATTLVGAQSPQVFPFTTGIAYAVRVRRQGQTLDVAVTPAAGGVTQSFGWTDPAVGRWGGGHIGFRWRAQNCEVTGTQLTQLQPAGRPRPRPRP